MNFGVASRRLYSDHSNDVMMETEKYFDKFGLWLSLLPSSVFNLQNRFVGCVPIKTFLHFLSNKIIYTHILTEFGSNFPLILTRKRRYFRGDKNKRYMNMLRIF